MSDRFASWLNEHHAKFGSLTETVVLTMTRLMADAKIPYLTITGRTKSVTDCLKKAKRKKYKSPISQMTDISGVRIVVYFDYDVDKVSKLIEENFSVDIDNSSNKRDILSVNEVGYRSVHFVCDLGQARTQLRENQLLSNLKFEFQVRTVLQHAWAELAHDRNYKFSEQLPGELERKLFLLAGLMESADNGFSDLSREIDEYRAKVAASTKDGDLDIEINSLSVQEFVSDWCERHNVNLSKKFAKQSLSDLINELDAYGITTLKELEIIIPEKFPEKFDQKYTTILSIVRDWMIIHDYKRILNNVDIEWVLTEDDIRLYRKFLSEAAISEIEDSIEIMPDPHDIDEFFDDVSEEERLAAYSRR